MSSVVVPNFELADDTKILDAIFSRLSPEDIIYATLKGEDDIDDVVEEIEIKAFETCNQRFQSSNGSCWIFVTVGLRFWKAFQYIKKNDDDVPTWSTLTGHHDEEMDIKHFLDIRNHDENLLLQSLIQDYMQSILWVRARFLYLSRLTRCQI